MSRGRRKRRPSQHGAWAAGKLGARRSQPLDYLIAGSSAVKAKHKPRPSNPEYLRALPYEQYLRTAHWRELRAEVLARWQGRCENCGEPACQVHHKTYERLGCERPSDLQPLCRRCHEALHGFGPSRPPKSASPTTTLSPSRGRSPAGTSGESGSRQKALAPR